ncbi:uncharacterized protein I206_102149 [Kwoniella pini CBS 10737]|uniref:Uncharacterized protein n=1 Tax=Kwoniella pini CBS 10737 TaxID=1296096 RepID=A0A1B9HUP9_9TREE|nr:uncharacterized protein I206_06757 [Kwoniella pini CBS 10737]OCF46983.1 hypothetical protein I206_06757 [Kwoniella pini CBS 10737]
MANILSGPSRPPVQIPSVTQSGPKPRTIRTPGVPLTFNDLSELYPLILSYLKLINPVLLLSVSKSLYTELLPTIYEKIHLNKYNTSLLFYGYSPLISSRNSIFKSKNHTRFLRDFVGLPGRRSRSSPPDIQTSEKDFSESQSRKSIALNFTKEIYLKDAESLSLICQVHMELLSYSPISSKRRRIEEETNNNNSSSWPLKNVKILKVGWKLIKYLAESHNLNNINNSKILPICCIPFEVDILIIEIEKLEKLRKRFLRQAISELSSEFTLEKLILKVEIPEMTRTRISSIDEDESLKSPKETDEEIYIPPIEHPPPASEILIILIPPLSMTSSYISSNCIENGKLVDVLVKCIHSFLEDTGRRNFRLPNIQIACPANNQVEHKIRNLIFANDGLGIARSVGRRAFDVTQFTDLSSITPYLSPRLN